MGLLGSDLWRCKAVPSALSPESEMGDKQD